MSVIPDHGIREMVRPTNGAHPTVFVPDRLARRFGPIEDRQIQPASLDVRLGPSLIRHPSGDRVDIPKEGYSLAPGECVLGSLVERLAMRADNVLARVEGKSSWGRVFLTIHSTAGFIDPGFCGDVTLELKNDGHARILLLPGVTIAQLSFEFLSASVERLYGSERLQSRYQGQIGPTESRRGR